MKTRLALTLTALATWQIALHGAAVPVDVTELKRLSLEELLNTQVTTVSRSESTVGQSPAAVHVITAEDIRRSGATTIPEVLRMAPGVHVARIDGNKWAIGVRGFSTRFSNKLLVQVDGRSVYTPLTAGVFWDSVNFPLEDIQRIEVIRGPGASMWGANAVNGVINIITKPAKDTPGGLLSAGGGTEERGFATFRWGGQIGEHLHYRIFASGFERDRQSSPEGDPNDDWRGGSAGLRLDWLPPDGVAFTLDAGYGRSETGINDRFPLSAGPPFARNFPQTEFTDTAHVLARWSRQLDSGGNWALQVYWDRFHRDSDYGFANLEWDTFDVDFQHEFPLGARQKIVWGLGYRHVRGALEDSVNDDGFYLTWLDRDPRTHLFSGFVQDEIALVPERWSLLLGTKVEHNHFTGWEVQPTVRLLWTPTARQSVWAAASRAVRTRTFTEDDAQFTAPPANPLTPPVARTVANCDLEPEEVWAYELGYRAQATDAFSVDAALFFNRYHDLRANRVNPRLGSTVQGFPLAASQFINGMDGEIYGLELAANWRVTPWWRLAGAYTFLKVNLHADRSLPILSQRSFEAAEGQDPQQQLYVRSSWDLPGHVEFDLIGRYVDRLRGFNPNGLPGVSDSVKDYVSLDARLAWRPTERFEISIVGQNLLDQHHAEFGTNAFIRSPLVEIERSVYGMITWKF